MAYPLPFPGTLASYRPNLAIESATERQITKTVAALRQGKKEGEVPLSKLR